MIFRYCYLYGAKTITFDMFYLSIMGLRYLNGLVTKCYLFSWKYTFCLFQFIYTVASILQEYTTSFLLGKYILFAFKFIYIMVYIVQNCIFFFRFMLWYFRAKLENLTMGRNCWWTRNVNKYCKKNTVRESNAQRDIFINFFSSKPR